LDPIFVTNRNRRGTGNEDEQEMNEMNRRWTGDERGMKHGMNRG
jgi:hypothetical protein